MARKLRFEYPGAIYHVMNRGDRREAIFRTDKDRQLFMETWGEICRKTGWQVHALCLMPNHFHLVVETPGANLVAGMKWFLGTYTARFNRRHKLFGHLFSGRYKSLIVEGSGKGYLKTVCDYVHLNPVRARLLVGNEKLSRYRWSSYPAYLQPAWPPEWLRVERLLGEHGLPKDSPAMRREFARRMEWRRLAGEDPAQLKQLRRGWCLGGAQFREELLAAMQYRSFGVVSRGHEAGKYDAQCLGKYYQPGGIWVGRQLQYCDSDEFIYLCRQWHRPVAAHRTGRRHPRNLYL
jgi:REP element-mobilizing transposase RayT